MAEQTLPKAQHNKPPPPKPQQRVRKRTETNADEEATKYYIKQAIKQRDMSALEELVARAEDLRLDGDVVEQAKELYEELRNGANEEQIGVLKHYLKQGLELRKREMLEMALDQADSIKAVWNNRLHSDFMLLTDEARKMLASMRVENAETLKHYLKQGIQLKDRQILKEALGKLRCLEEGQLPKELVEKAQELVQKMDAEHLVLFYLENAVRAKDQDALSQALEKTVTLRMDQTTKDIKKARKLLKQMLKKGRSRRTLTKGSGLALPVARVFGATLRDACQRSRLIIPTVVADCVEFLRQKGLNEPGLFRVPGNKDRMSELRRMYQEGEKVELDDVNDTAGLLKLYLRQLPEPLIKFDMFEAFIKIGQETPAGGKGRLQALQKLCAELPRENLATLSFLMYFLNEVSMHDAENKMTANNLAICFQPNILKRPQNEETYETMLSDSGPAVSVVSNMVAFPTAVFPPRPRTLVKS